MNTNTNTAAVTAAELTEAAATMTKAQATDWAAMLHVQVEKVGKGLGVDVDDDAMWSKVASLFLTRTAEREGGRRLAVNMLAAGLVLAD